jgi:pimeloyl-ACP methyl ester carboxylesterase
VEKLIFLPGASGQLDFWAPVAERLRHAGTRRFVGWPGFGGLPPEPEVRGLDDLVPRVTREVDGPVALLAQSMGGVIALRAALERPDLVRSLVLTATSGGIDVAALGGVDWRPTFQAHNPGLPGWFADDRTDLGARLREVRVPVLLLWGDADPISPVAVGRQLADLLPDAELIVVAGGTHDLAFERAPDIVPHIDRHLARGSRQ